MTPAGPTGFEPEGAQIVERLLGYLRFARAWRFVYGHEPRPGSPLHAQRVEEADLACEWDDEPVWRSAYIGALQLVAAEEHLSGLAVLLRDTTTVLPAMTLFRALLENAARSWWLLDPAIEARTRIARGMTEELYSQSQAKNLPPHLRPAVQTDVIERSTMQLGLPWRAGGTPAVGEGRPSSTDLVSRFIDDIGGREGALRYRWTSAITHGTVHGLMTMVRLMEDGTGTFELHPKTFVSSVVDSAVCYGHAFESYVRLWGGDLDRWLTWHGESMGIFATALDHMGGAGAEHETEPFGT